MNEKRIRQLADHLRGLLWQPWWRRGDAVRMDTWRQHVQDENGDHCGTVACVAGWAVELFDPDCDTPTNQAAREILGLCDRSASGLFYPPELDRRQYSGAHAAQVLDELVVDPDMDITAAWEKAYREIAR